MQYPVIRFEVLGEPKSQGSKRAMPIYKHGQPVLKNGRMLTRVVDDKPKLAEWRQEIKHAACQAYDGPLLTGAIRLTLCFTRPRPKGHFGKGRNAGKLKASAPEHPTQRPDTLKLGRAIEDSLTGVVWQDDSQVVHHLLTKKYGVRFCVSVTVESLDGETEPEANDG